MKKSSISVLAIILGLCLLAGCNGGAAPVATTAAPTTAAAAAETTAAATTVATTAAEAAAGPKGPSYVNASGLPIPAEDIPAMKMLVAQGENQKPAGELQYFVEMEKLTGVKWEYVQPASSAFTDQMTLMFSSNDLPDAVYNARISTANEYNWGSGGIIVPLEDMIAEYGVNFKAVADKFPDLMKTIRSADGHIYTMPCINDSPKEVQRLWVNYNWATKWDLTKNRNDDMGVYEDSFPTTLDGFYDLLVRFRDEDPNGNGEKDEIPLSFSKGMFGGTGANTSYTPSAVILSYFGLVGKGISEDKENGKVFFTSIDERYKEYLKFMHKLFVEKLLDNESFTQDSDQLNAKGKGNLVGVTGGWNAIAYQYSEGSDLDKLKGSSIPALTSQWSATPVYPFPPVIDTGTYAITKACKYPEVAYRWVDVNYGDTVEDILRLFWGGSWKWEDEAKQIWQGVVPEGQGEAWRSENLTNAGDFGTPYFADMQVMDVLQGGETGITDRYKFRNAERFLPYKRLSIPKFGFTPDELETIATYGPDIYSYCDEMEAAFISGATEIDAGWDSYVGTLQKMHLDDLVKVYQGGLDRFNSY